MTKILSRSDFKAAERRRIEVPIPEFGGSIYVQSMTAGEAGEHLAKLIDRKTAGVGGLINKSKELVIIATAVNEEGTKLFTLADLDFISGWDSSIVDRIHTAAQQVNAGETVAAHEKN